MCDNAHHLQFANMTCNLLLRRNLGFIIDVGFGVRTESKDVNTRIQVTSLKGNSKFQVALWLFAMKTTMMIQKKYFYFLFSLSLTLQE